MAKKKDVPCAGGCGRLVWTGSKKCCECSGRAFSRPAASNAGRVCLDAECEKPARKRGMCNTHYNKATGHYIGTVAKDPDRERARLRLKTHRRHARDRLTDITPEYEMAMRAKAKCCPMDDCGVVMVDEPYLSNSKELDHMVPQSVGGTHTVGNVRIICRKCNLARPKDGSDFLGQPTLWAQEAAVIHGRAIARCPHGKPPSARCYDCRPRRIAKAKPVLSPVYCRLCGAVIPRTGARGRPRLTCPGDCTSISPAMHTLEVA